MIKILIIIESVNTKYEYQDSALNICFILGIIREYYYFIFLQSEKMKTIIAVQSYIFLVIGGALGKL